MDAIYEDKPATYFACAREDVVSLMNTHTGSAVLELGCAAGGTGRAALAAGKAGTYVGLELTPEAGAVASQFLTEVRVGDVQSMDLSDFRERFDALVLSEVLEHVVDPWATMDKLSACLKPGAQVVASSPNISHWRVISKLLLGHFDYQPEGVMDRTHLRWFTPSTFKALFEGSGFKVASLRSRQDSRPRARAFNALTGGRFAHLSITQMVLVGYKA